MMGSPGPGVVASQRVRSMSTRGQQSSSIARRQGVVASRTKHIRQAAGAGINLIKGINQKGLFAYGGRAKPAVAVVRRLYERRPPG